MDIYKNYQITKNIIMKGDIKMSKQNRGKALWKLPSRGRGTCPICKAGRIKLLYELVAGDGKKVKVCKRCQNKKIDKLD
jgi:hypothetical protein